MEEFESSSLFLTLYKLFCESVILIHDLRKVFLTDGVRLFRSCNYRLHGKLLKAEVRIVEDIISEIQIVSCEGSANEIILLAA